MITITITQGDDFKYSLAQTGVVGDKKNLIPSGEERKYIALKDLREQLAVVFDAIEEADTKREVIAGALRKAIENYNLPDVVRDAARAELAKYEKSATN